MSLPYMPLYVADYLADTSHLTAAEHGAYLMLIMHYWRQGSLPTEDCMLQRISRMTGREWARSRVTIVAMFSKDGWGQIPALRAVGVYEPTSRPPIPKDIKAAVQERDGPACVYCGSNNGPFHFDHVLPWSRGGRHTVENLVIACAPCNLEKGARMPKEWLQ